MKGKRKSRGAVIEEIFLRQCKFLERQYPALLKLDLSVTPASAQTVFELYCWQVKRLDPTAGAQDLIEQCERMLRKTSTPQLREEVIQKLTELRVARGMAHKVLPFLEADHPARKTIDALGDEHARHYGRDLRKFDMSNVNRGDCLRFYFSRNTDVLGGKRVLHMAPEGKLRPWMQKASARLGFTYETADGFLENVDHHVDLCALSFADEQYDIIILHRVLEHVIDDAMALQEIHRVLKPGGILNISVPEQLYMERTSEWRVPDPKAHMHFRIYGRDFPSRLRKAGFRPGRCDWLFKQPDSELRKFGAYPMLFYNALKR